MPIVPAQLVPAPSPGRPRRGLFNAAPVRPLDRHGEGGGVRYVPNCGTAWAYPVACGQAGQPTKPVGGVADEIESGVFAVISTLQCSTVGYTEAELETRLRRTFTSAEQAVVETTLFTGADFQGTPLGILNLDDEAVGIPAGFDSSSIAGVISALEQFAYVDQQYPGAAYLHAPIGAMAYAAQARLIEQDGTRQTTPAGSIWVFGAYPEGELFITGQTTVWRASEVSVIGVLDPVTNQRLLVAERAYAVAFECFAGRGDFLPAGS